MRTTWLLSLAMLLLASPATRAHADESRRGKVAVGLGAHAASSLGLVCEWELDVDGCSSLQLFVGGDLSAHYFLLDWLAVGARAAGSVPTNHVSGSTLRAQESEALWRFSAEAKLYPSALSGLWLGAELGGAWLNESLSPHSVTQSAVLVGGALGWDFLELGKHLQLGVDARVQLLTFAEEAPMLDAAHSLHATKYGAAPWLQLGAHVGYLF
jgi:hypothetical protein